MAFFKAIQQFNDWDRALSVHYWLGVGKTALKFNSMSLFLVWSKIQLWLQKEHQKRFFATLFVVLIWVCPRTRIHCFGGLSLQLRKRSKHPCKQSVSFPIAYISYLSFFPRILHMVAVFCLASKIKLRRTLVQTLENWLLMVSVNMALISFYVISNFCLGNNVPMTPQ